MVCWDHHRWQNVGTPSSLFFTSRWLVMLTVNRCASASFKFFLKILLKYESFFFHILGGTISSPCQTGWFNLPSTWIRLGWSRFWKLTVAFSRRAWKRTCVSYWHSAQQPLFLLVAWMLRGWRRLRFLRNPEQGAIYSWSWRTATHR